MRGGGGEKGWGIRLQEETPKASKWFWFFPGHSETRSGSLSHHCRTGSLSSSQGCRDLMEDYLTCSYSHICLFEGGLRPSRLMAA